MAQTLQVEYQELMARADELEQPLPEPPSTPPTSPCELSFIVNAAVQLAFSADTIRMYLKYCEREYKRLAESLRNAAKAYEEVDEGAAEAITTNSSVSGVTAGSAGGNGQMLINCDPDEDYLPPAPPPPPPEPELPYYELRQAAYDIEAPDQGAGFKAFADEWESFQIRLQTMVFNRFRLFSDWESDSALLVEANFQEHRDYMTSMLGFCSQIAKQARAVVAAHRTARLDHPDIYLVTSVDKFYERYTREGDPHDYLPGIISWYYKLQQKSEDALANYRRDANLPLATVNPRRPPAATRIDPDTPGEDGGIDPGNPDGLPFDGGNLPMMPMMPMTGMPTTPSMPDSAALDEALKDLKGSPTGAGAGLKPASLGGGGAGVPKMPLQPSVDAEAASRPAAAGPGTTGLGRAMPGKGGAMGGGMGGMAPMGAPGQGQNQGKGKGTQQADDALYTEERAWTEGVIGNRPRKSAADGKDSK